jgi:aspartate/methionine/tyrosine aminotransferase
MLHSPLAPYLLWAKTRQPAAIDLAGSNLLQCALKELPGVREAVELSAPNDNGYPPLVGAIARHEGVPTDHVVTAGGCSGANFLAIAALVGAGDDVLIERPTYDPLIGACRLLGANVQRFDRKFEDGYALDLETIAARITPRTKLIVVTTPHNPSGIILDSEPLVALGRLATSAGAYVLVDEVYLDVANLIRPSGQAIRSAARLEGPFVSTSSLTKSFGLAGLRCGWAIASPGVAERLRRTRDVVDNIGSGPADRLSVLAFFELARLSERARKLLSVNVERAQAFLSANPELEVAGTPASSVIFPRLAGVDDAEPFVQRLLDEEGVAVAPGRFFDSPAHFRISLAGRSDALDAGLTKIGHALKKLGA